jgi:hypothetical protein
MFDCLGPGCLGECNTLASGAQIAPTCRSKAPVTIGCTIRSRSSEGDRHEMGVEHSAIGTVADQYLPMPV